VGLEASTDLRLRLLTLLAVDLRGELFLPDADASLTVVEECSADLRLSLTRYAELSWLMELTDARTETLGDTESSVRRFRPRSAVTLRLFANF
jgi:hypothetical protein